MEIRPGMANNTLFQSVWESIQNESVNSIYMYIGYIRFSFISSAQMMIGVYRYQVGNEQTRNVSFATMYFEL